MTSTTHRADLRTKLREYRKARGWTLAYVASALGTTPQTVSRLETNVMTVSTDWLQRFADLFEVDVASFFDSPSQTGARFLGAVGPGGVIQPAEEPDVPLPLVDGSVFVAVMEAYGSYQKDQYILAEQMTDPSHGLDKVCLAQVKGGQAILARLIKGSGSLFTLVPQDGSPTHYDCEIEWAAVPVFSIQDLR